MGFESQGCRRLIPSSSPTAVADYPLALTRPDITPTALHLVGAFGERRRRRDVLERVVIVGGDDSLAERRPGPNRQTVLDEDLARQNDERDLAERQGGDPRHPQLVDAPGDRQRVAERDDRAEVVDGGRRGEVGLETLEGRERVELESDRRARDRQLIGRRCLRGGQRFRDARREPAAHRLCVVGRRAGDPFASALVAGAALEVQAGQAVIRLRQRSRPADEVCRDVGMGAAAGGSRMASVDEQRGDRSASIAVEHQRCDLGVDDAFGERTKCFVGAPVAVHHPSAGVTRPAICRNPLDPSPATPEAGDRSNRRGRLSHSLRDAFHDEVGVDLVHYPQAVRGENRLEIVAEVRRAVRVGDVDDDVLVGDAGRPGDGLADAPVRRLEYAHEVKANQGKARRAALEDQRRCRQRIPYFVYRLAQRQARRRAEGGRDIAPGQAGLQLHRRPPRELIGRHRWGRGECLRRGRVAMALARRIILHLRYLGRRLPEASGSGEEAFMLT